MSLMKPPQTRYRVEERGGQLVVIDTLSGGAPATARDLMGGERITYARASEAITARTPDRAQASLSGSSKPVVSAIIGTPSRALDPARSETFDPNWSPSEPQASLGVRKAAPTNPWSAPSPMSRPPRSHQPFGTLSTASTTLHTQRWYDKNAPRTIILSPKRIQQAMIFFALILIAAVLLIGFFEFITLFIIGFVLFRVGLSTFITTWLNMVERENENAL